MTFDDFWKKFVGEVGICLDHSRRDHVERARKIWNEIFPQWQPPETAPKDGATFLADVGNPWPVVCVWSKAHEEWAYADYQIDMLDGEWVDAYFQTEHEKPEGLRAWMPLPKINK